MRSPKVIFSHIVSSRLWVLTFFWKSSLACKETELFPDLAAEVIIFLESLASLLSYRLFHALTQKNALCVVVIIY